MFRNRKLYQSIPPIGLKTTNLVPKKYVSDDGITCVDFVRCSCDVCNSNIPRYADYRLSNLIATGNLTPVSSNLLDDKPTSVDIDNIVKQIDQSNNK